MGKSMSEKIREARASMGLSQSKLAEVIGVTSRSVQAYELGEKKPRLKVMLPLARALNVSSTYLSDDECTDPAAGIEKDRYLEAVQQSFGTKGVKEIDSLITASIALMAGGEISPNQKREYFEAIQIAYVDSMREAKVKFSPKKNAPIENEAKSAFGNMASLSSTNENAFKDALTLPIESNDATKSDVPQAEQPQQKLIEVVQLVPKEDRKQQE